MISNLGTKLIYIFIFLNCSGNNLLTQGKWQTQNPLPTESYLLTVESVTDNKIFAGGLGGTLLNTNDAGKTWTVKKFKDLVDIRGISFKDSLNGWLNDSEHIYHTIDGGESWNEVYVEVDLSTYYFMKIISFDNTIYLFLKPQTAVLWELIDAKSLVLKSTDGGKTWVQIKQEIKGKMLCAFFLNESYGFLYSEETVSINESFTSFYKTTDGGVTWAKSRFPKTNWTLNMCFVNQNTGFIGKFKTTDGGKTWENMFDKYIPQSENINDIYFADSLNGWAVNWAKIFQTTDGGISWKELVQHGSNQLTDINFTTDGTGWIVGWAGNIFRKQPDTNLWEPMSKGNRNSLNDVFFIDEKEGWCVGTYGCILHTSNGGNIWEEQRSPIDSVLFKVKFLNHFEGWIAGYYTVVHTTDGGKNWEVRNDLYGWFVDVDFFDDKNGLLIERTGAVLRTTDGGINWQLVNDNPLSERLTSIAIVNENEAWIGGWLGLGHTTDKGATIQWYKIPNLSLVRDIQFVDNNYGFLINDFAQFMKTTDGGWSWDEIPRGTGLELGPIQTFYMLDQNNGWIYWDYKGGLIRNVKVNYTISALEYGQYSVPAITKIYFINSNLGWAVGAGGTILKYTGEGSPQTVAQRQQINIYPNPFSESGTNISFYLQQPQEVSIQVYNSIGQKVQTLYNGSLNGGDIKFFWKSNFISSGIYFISIRCNEFNQVQKCIFLNY
ncbi:MAG: YCF48-related protein [Ignavibacteriales bacterium]|nr:YCF48-related protein [Ignavibacteriales bacterium]